MQDLPILKVNTRLGGWEGVAAIDLMPTVVSAKDCIYPIVVPFYSVYHNYR